MANGILTLSIIALICGFWIYIFGRALYRSLTSKKSENDDHSGRMVSGKVVVSSVKGSGKFSRVNMTVEFPNFSNADVRESFVFKDTRPEENRYEEGKFVQLILDDDPKKGPSVRLAGSKTGGSGFARFLVFLVFCGTIYGTFILFQLIDKKLSGDWNNVDQLEIFEGFSIMAAGMIFSLLIMQIVFRAVKIFPGKKQKDNEKKLKLYGLKAIADITKVEETGTRINDNPVIRFHYEFEDDFGNKHKGKDQQILGMIELANINDIKQKEVLYLKEDPSSSRMMDALKGNFMAGCSKLIYLFIFFTFSVVLIALFVSGLIDS